MRRAVFAMATLALAACASPEITETSVLRSPPRPERAAGEGPLDLKNQARLAPAHIRHGFIGEGDVRIAYTLVEAGPRDRPLFVHCGGGRADRYRAGVIYAGNLIRWGDVLLFDYPGYGDSGGVASVASFNAIVEPVGAFATAQARGRKLIFWGHSLGGMVCASIAGKTPAASAMIFEASARTIRGARTSDTVAQFDSIEALRPMTGPVLILAGERDETITPQFSRAFAAAARESRQDVTYVEFPDAGHIDIPLARGFETRISTFLASIPARSPIQGQ